MPIISEQMKKAAKKAAAQEKKRKEEEDKRMKEEQAKKEQEEKEAKEREEQEKKQKRMEKKQKIKDRITRHKKQKSELERKANMRKEMAFIKKTMGPKVIKDEALIERQGLSILRAEIKSGAHSKVYKAKQGEKELVCKVVILDKTPMEYRKNLLDVSLKVQRYIGGGATDSLSTGGGTDPKNPGFTKVIDIYATDKKVYIFMEECERKSVIEKFKKSETPDENEVKKTIKELAQTLQYLHGLGVAHNNLRSSSVVYDKENRVKLLGLDMCCFFWDPDMETVVTKKKLQKKEFDKNNYLPPEAFNADNYDPSLGDVWALGLLMCQMIAQDNPFKIRSEQPFDEQWKAFAQTKQFSDEAKQFLDRIFVLEAPTRPTISDLLDDAYLKKAGKEGSAKEKDTSKEAPKDGTNDASKEASKEAAKDGTKDASKEASKEAGKEPTDPNAATPENAANPGNPPNPENTGNNP